MNSTGTLGALVLGSEASIGGDAGLQNILNTYGATAAYPYITTAAAAGLPSNLVNPNHLRFTPRVGWAWRPSINNSTVIRGSYGIFFTGSRLSALRTELAGNFPFSIVEAPTGIKGSPLQGVFTLNPGVHATSVNGYDPNAPSSYLESYNVTVERELPKGLAVEIAYSGSRGLHLGWQVDVNQGQPSMCPTCTPASGPASGSSYPRPFAYFASARVFQFNAFSNYNAGTITVRKRFEHGLLFRANYTWAKNLDMNSALNYAGNGGYQGAQDSTNQKVEYGRADDDRRMVFNGNFVYALPFNRNFVVKGWQMAGSWQVDSGTPFTPQYNGPSQSDGLATRPDRVCNGGLPTSQRTVGQFFNTAQTGPGACFPTPAGFFGTSRRNILDGPGLYTVNWSLSRNFRITDSGKLQFRWEVFNLLNHPNFKLPNDNLDEAAAGSITTAGDPRAMQLGAKYTF